MMALFSYTTQPVGVEYYTLSPLPTGILIIYAFTTAIPTTVHDNYQIYKIPT